MNKISVIIPVYNEVDNIKKLINHLIKSFSEKNIQEIIIVDGGSTDGTQDISIKMTDRAEVSVILLKSAKGRAKQMNFGAEYATGDILYFLHADSYPPQNFDKYILEHIEKGYKSGCFRMKFESNHWWLKIAGFLTALPWKICRGGDQSLFVYRNLFDEVGGYDEEYIIYEDNDLIWKLYDQSEFAVIPKWLKTSARCYTKNGLWKTQFCYWRIHIKKWLGASPQELHHYYKQKILNI